MPGDPTDREPPSKATRFFRAAQVASLGLEMGIAVGIGAGIGYLLDSWLGTKPWLMLVFLLLGVAAGFRGMFSAARRVNSDVAASNRRKGEDRQNHGSERARQD